MNSDSKIKRFKFVGGDAALDFVNTVAGRDGNLDKTRARDYQDRPRADKLEDYADLLGWSGRAKLLAEAETIELLSFAEREPAAAVKTLKRARALRESAYRLFKCAIEGWQPEPKDLTQLNQELAIARCHQTLAWSKKGFDFRWNQPDDQLDSMLWRVADATARLLANGDLTRVKQCAGDKCRWLFLDTSRNRSRNWCDMKDCGNLAKVRRFRQKPHV